MIDFACKKFNLNEIIKCSLGLSKADYKLFSFLLYQHSEMTTNEISLQIGLDRTTIQKSVKKLVEKGVVLRLQENLSKGGYIYKYRIKEKEILKNKIIKILRFWSEKAEEEIRHW